MHTMIIAPHMDDEVYGASSFLQGDGPQGGVTLSTGVVYMNSTHATVRCDTLQRENEAVVHAVGCSRIVFDSPGANALDFLPSVDLVNFFEEQISKHRPHTVLLPFPSYNQDHRVTYETALTALRPHDRIPLVQRVLVYEEPETHGAMRVAHGRPFHPTYFRPLDLSRKLMLMAKYASQVREHRSFAHVSALAELRGMVSGYRHAEGFEVLRWVE